MVLKLPIASELRCPCARKSEVTVKGARLVCAPADCPHATMEGGFRCVNNRAVMISASQCDTLCAPDDVVSYVKRSAGRFFWLRRLMGGGNARLTGNNCRAFLELLEPVGRRARVLIIGAGERGLGTQALWEDNNLDIYGTDIYLSDTVSTVCDAHYLPFEDGYFDGVWVQAVLEHVVDAPRVVEEIARVLTDRGAVYSEVPFMQQVHEGAYDFARYTLSGYRYLFKQFEKISSDVLDGPGVALSWSFRFWVWSVTRSLNLARLANLVAALFLKLSQPLESRRSKYDSYSGSYFLGRKSATPICHKDLVSLYRGNMR